MTSSGRVGFVTGASQGIGRACALQLAKTGTAVALVLQKYVIVFATAFAGAWSMILGGLALSTSYALTRIVSSNGDTSGAWYRP